MGELHDDRRIVAILFTDVVGYSSLTERDESAAIRVRERHRTLVKTLATQFEGELIDSTGDEALAIFPSALLAVDCALALQAALRDDRELALRIGIHLGDVARRGAEVIGEGVNVAARIRPLAEPGGICVSEPVYQMVRNRAHIQATSLGAQALKNISVPLNVFALSSAARSPSRKKSRRRRIAIAAATLLFGALGITVWILRAPILADIALAAPRYFSDPIAQKLGFATTSDGVKIAYAVTGSGPPVIYVLGWGTHLERGVQSPLYDRFGFIAKMSEQNTLVRYDGRGFGLSERHVTDFSIDARARDIEAVADALQLTRFSIYAVSGGGPAAIDFAARHPERVEQLILVASSAGYASIPHTAQEIEQYDGIIHLMATSWDSPAVRDMWVSILMPDIDEVGRRVVNEFLRISGDGAAMAGYFRESEHEDVSSIAAQVRVPTLVIHGDQDTTMPFAYGVRLASLIPSSRFEILKGADHRIAAFDPRVVKLALAFLAEGGATVATQ